MSHGREHLCGLPHGAIPESPPRRPLSTQAANQAVDLSFEQNTLGALSGKVGTGAERGEEESQR